VTGLIVQLEFAGVGKDLHVAGWTRDELPRPVPGDEAGSFIGLDGLAADAVENAALQEYVGFYVEILAHFQLTLFGKEPVSLL